MSLLLLFFLVLLVEAKQLRVVAVRLCCDNIPISVLVECLLMYSLWSLCIHPYLIVMSTVSPGKGNYRTLSACPLNLLPWFDLLYFATMDPSIDED